MGCRVATLGELSLDNGKYGIAASAVDFDTELPAYLRITDINDDGTLNKLDRKSVNDPSACKYMLSEGDIVFARTGNSTGRNYFYDPRDGKFAFAGFLVKFSLDASKVNPRFVKYYAQSRAYWDWVASFKTGSTRGNINAKTYAQMPIPLPERSAQNSIVALCDCISDKIRVNAKLNGYLAELVSLEFMSRFSENVPTVELGQVLSISTKSLKPQDCFGEVWEHYSIPAYDEKHWPVFEPADGIKSNKYIVDKDCILISKLNPTTKRIWMPACSSNRPVCSTEFIVYKPNEPKHKSFYYAAIDAPAFTDFLLAHVTGSTGSRQRTQPKATLVYPMPAPGTEAIEDFCAFADPIYEQIKANELESKQLEELRDVLLPRLMSGKIDVSKVDLAKLNSHLAERRHSPLQLQDCR